MSFLLWVLFYALNNRKTHCIVLYWKCFSAFYSLCFSFPKNAGTIILSFFTCQPKSSNLCNPSVFTQDQYEKEEILILLLLRKSLVFPENCPNTIMWDLHVKMLCMKVKWEALEFLFSLHFGTEHKSRNFQLPKCIGPEKISYSKPWNTMP